LTALTTVCYSW